MGCLDTHEKNVTVVPLRLTPCAKPDKVEYGPSTALVQKYYDEESDVMMETLLGTSGTLTSLVDKITAQIEDMYRENSQQLVLKENKVRTAVAGAQRIHTDNKANFDKAYPVFESALKRQKPMFERVKSKFEKQDEAYPQKYAENTNRYVIANKKTEDAFKKTYDKMWKKENK